MFNRRNSLKSPKNASGKKRSNGTQEVHPDSESGDNLISLLSSQKSSLHQVTTGQSLENVSIDQNTTTAHPQLSNLLRTDSTNALVGGGVGTFTSLMGYQKASFAAAGEANMLQLTNGGAIFTGENGSPNSTSCTSGLADLSWASNESAVRS